MSYIRKYRVNSGDIVSTSGFYFKVEGGGGKMLCNLCVGNAGIYYYRAKSQILSPKESKKTRDTYDGFISMENLTQLFVELQEAQLGTATERGTLKIKRERRSVIIEAEK